MPKFFKNSEGNSLKKFKISWSVYFQNISRKSDLGRIAPVELKTVNYAPTEKGTAPKTVLSFTCHRVCFCKYSKLLIAEL